MRREIDPIDAAIGEELKKARDVKQLTMTEVALRMGCTRQLISFYESGKATIRINQLIKLCDIYDTNYGDLLNKVKKYAYKK